MQNVRKKENFKEIRIWPHVQTVMFDYLVKTNRNTLVKWLYMI